MAVALLGRGREFCLTVPLSLPLFQCVLADAPR